MGDDDDDDAGESLLLLPIRAINVVDGRYRLAAAVPRS